MVKIPRVSSVAKLWTEASNPDRIEKVPETQHGRVTIFRLSSFEDQRDYFVRKEFCTNSDFEWIAFHPNFKGKSGHSSRTAQEARNFPQAWTAGHALVSPARACLAVLRRRKPV